MITEIEKNTYFSEISALLESTDVFASNGVYDEKDVTENRITFSVFLEDPMMDSQNSSNSDVYISAEFLVDIGNKCVTQYTLSSFTSNATENSSIQILNGAPEYYDYSTPEIELSLRFFNNPKNGKVIDDLAFHQNLAKFFDTLKLLYTNQ